MQFKVLLIFFFLAICKAWVEDNFIFWYTGFELDCILRVPITAEKTFKITVFPFWPTVINEYCSDGQGTVIKVGKNGSYCNQSDLRTLEIDCKAIKPL